METLNSNQRKVLESSFQISSKLVRRLWLHRRWKMAVFDTDVQQKFVFSQAFLEHVKQIIATNISVKI